MGCDAIGAGLPLEDDDVRAAEVLAHLSACPACAARQAEYEADAEALAAYGRAIEAESPPALLGFADEVMARIAAAPVAAPLAPLEGAPPRAGALLRPSFGAGAWLAAAAALLVGLGLALALGLDVERRAPGTEAALPLAPTVDVADVVDAPTLPVASPLEPTPVAAPPRALPRRVRPLPRPRPARNSGIVPVEGERGGTGRRLLEDLIEGLNPRLMGAPRDRLPPLREGEREVEF